MTQRGEGELKDQGPERTVLKDQGYRGLNQREGEDEYSDIRKDKDGKMRLILCNQFECLGGDAGDIKGQEKAGRVSTGPGEHSELQQLLQSTAEGGQQEGHDWQLRGCGLDVCVARNLQQFY